MRGWGLYFVGEGQFILHPFSSIFSFWDAFFACDALIFNFPIFIFKVDGKNNQTYETNFFFIHLVSFNSLSLTGKPALTAFHKNLY